MAVGALLLTGAATGAAYDSVAAAQPVAAEYLAGESGILIILGYGAAAAWLLWRIGATTSSSTFASPCTRLSATGSAPSIVVP
jgi:hypothetical protein